MNGTLFIVAMRQYEIEIDLLASAVNDLKEALESLAVEGVEVHRRMPHRIEEEMIKQFPIYLKDKTNKS